MKTYKKVVMVFNSIDTFKHAIDMLLGFNVPFQYIVNNEKYIYISQTTLKKLNKEIGYLDLYLGYNNIMSLTR